MEEIIKTVDLVKKYDVGGGFRNKKYLHAVDGVNIRISKGEAVGLVGESGSGKSTIARLILRLIKPTSGKIIYRGKDIWKLDGDELKHYRRNVQIVFQNPLLSLNPSLNVYQTLSEPMLYHKIATKQTAMEKVKELLDLVGLSQEHIQKYPHELSGGQMQRVAIARSLSLNPEFVVFDEPTSSLDVSAQAQVLNLIRRLSKMFNLTYLLISHNLAVVSNICDRIYVMYSGKIVEESVSENFFREPRHPYSMALLQSVPRFEKNDNKSRYVPAGEPASNINPKKECRFVGRCPYAMKVCSEMEPQLVSVDSSTRVACFLYEKGKNLAN